VRCKVLCSGTRLYSWSPSFPYPQVHHKSFGECFLCHFCLPHGVLPSHFLSRVFTGDPIPDLVPRPPFREFPPPASVPGKCFPLFSSATCRFRPSQVCFFKVAQPFSQQTISYLTWDGHPFSSLLWPITFFNIVPPFCPFTNQNLTNGPSRFSSLYSLLANARLLIFSRQCFLRTFSLPSFLGPPSIHRMGKFACFLQSGQRDVPCLDYPLR